MKQDLPEAAMHMISPFFFVLSDLGLAEDRPTEELFAFLGAVLKK
jgi:hypothetical protein